MIETLIFSCMRRLLSAAELNLKPWLRRTEIAAKPTYAIQTLPAADRAPPVASTQGTSAMVTDDNLRYAESVSLAQAGHIQGTGNREERGMTIGPLTC